MLNINMSTSSLTLTPAAPDGCHGSPILFNGKCVAILSQPRIGPVADTATLMHKVLPKSYHETGPILDSRINSHLNTGSNNHNNDIDINSFAINPSLFSTTRTAHVGKGEVDVLTKAVRSGNLETVLKLQNQLGTETLREWRDFNGMDSRALCRIL